MASIMCFIICALNFFKRNGLDFSWSPKFKPAASWQSSLWDEDQRAGPCSRSNLGKYRRSETHGASELRHPRWLKLNGGLKLAQGGLRMHRITAKVVLGLI